MEDTPHPYYNHSLEPQLGPDKPDDPVEPARPDDPIPDYPSAPPHVPHHPPHHDPHHDHNPYLPPHDEHQFQPNVPPPAPLAPPPPEAESVSPGIVPQPVVRVLSPRGVEYVFLAISLITAATGLISALLAMVNTKFDFSVLAFPVSLLVVSVPIFAWLFLRLKYAELRDPRLRLDASKRRSTQFIQILSFVVCFFTMIGFMTTLFAKSAGDYSGSVLKLILNVAVIELVTGGILVYYWRDEHRSA